MSNRPLYIGIVGAGANTCAKHIPLLKEQAGVHITAVCNRRVSSAQKVATEWDIPTVYDHWQELMDDESIDAVVIGTWPYLHEPITVAALEAGKHVLCEARMAMDASSARVMLEESILHPDLVAQIVPSPFTLPWDQTIMDRISGGELGYILAVDVFANCGNFCDPERPMTWREDRSLSGLNTMMLGIYYEDLARWIGHARAVVAMGKTHVRQRKDAEGRLRSMDIPDHLDVLADMACGAQAHIRCSQVTGGCPTPNDFVLYGSRATLRLDIIAGVLSLQHKDDDVPHEVEVDAGRRGAWRVEEEFIRAIRGEEKISHTAFDEAYRYMEFTEAVIKSAGSGARVSVPLL